MYVVKVRSQIYGTAEFNYDNKTLAFVGLQRLINKGLEQQDNILRWYTLDYRLRYKTGEHDPASTD